MSIDIIIMTIYLTVLAVSAVIIYKLSDNLIKFCNAYIGFVVIWTIIMCVCMSVILYMYFV